ncbi:DUF469 family protein [Paraburkholderia sp. Tr-20389]|nr:DUF469 family protein [Paraburkholderia sp. Tr-20389]
MARNRTRRLRKKLHIGEFQEFGFEVVARLASPLSSEERDKLLDLFIEQCIEPSDLGFGGGLNDDLSGFAVSMQKRGSATDEQRETVRLWLDGRSEFSVVDVAPLTDAWYPRAIT